MAKGELGVLGVVGHVVLPVAWSSIGIIIENRAQGVKEGLLLLLGF